MHKRSLIMIVLLGAILSSKSLAAHSPAPFASPHSRAKNDPGVKIAFVDALINSFKGAAALKATCRTVWHSNEKTTFVEQQQCSGARKEIALAKQYYPQLLEFVRKYRDFNPKFSVSGIGPTLGAASASSGFVRLCKDQTATRAAKTMDYWGTTKQGDWYYKDLAEMGAANSGEVLDACKSGSWAYKIIDTTKSEFILAVSAVESIARKGDSESYCVASPPGGWNEARFSSLKEVSKTYSNALAFAESTTKASDKLGFLGVQPEIDKLDQLRLTLNEASNRCSQTLLVAEKAIELEEQRKAQQERELRARRERERIAAEERKAAAAAAQRRSQAEAAERQRREAERKNAIDGVKF